MMPTRARARTFEHHVHMVALHTVWYDLVRIHKTLWVTAAMAAGLTDKLTDMREIAEMIGAALPKAGRPKSYKKRAV